MRNFRTKAPRIAAVITCLCLLSSFSHATLPPPPPDLANELEFASFAGVIECLEQGPKVSRFRAVESWYGQAEGEFWLVGGAVPGMRYAVLMGPYLAHTEATGVVGTYVMNSGVGAVWIPRWPSPLADRFDNSYIYPIDDNGTFFGEKPYDEFATLGEMKQRFTAFFAEVESGKRARKPLTKVHSVELNYRDSDESIRFHRKTFKSGFQRLSSDEVDSWVESYLVLSDTDPGYVCRLLKNGRFLALNENSRGPSYVLTDIFCQTRTGGQVKYVEDLTRSRDPMTSMIATMHLYFRSPDNWRERLEAKAAGDDTIATWAALILTCDGDKAYVGKALKICVADLKSDFSDISQRYMRYWLLSLFSNSAVGTNMEPPVTDYLYDDDNAAVLVTWWTEHKDEIDLVPLTRVPIDPTRVFERLDTAGGEGYGYFGLY